MTKPPAVKITSLSTAPQRQMKNDKGTARDLVGLPDGAEAVDLHLNVLHSDAPVSPYHIHKKAENVYIILEGTAVGIIDGVRHILTAGDVVFIPPGVPHAVGGSGRGPVKLLEVYAPAGSDFHPVDPPPGSDSPTPQWSKA